jgi:hypothetical protein
MEIIHRAISTHIMSRAGFTNKQAKTGAVTLIQHFGSALNLNIHFHMLFLEGDLSENPWGGTTFSRIKAPSYEGSKPLKLPVVSYKKPCKSMALGFPRNVLRGPLALPFYVPHHANEL